MTGHSTVVELRSLYRGSVLKFCSTYDETLAKEGPAAVFLPDKRGAWRFDAEWSRDAWLREEGPHQRNMGYRLWRDANTGYIVLLMVSSDTLLTTHPKGQLRTFRTLDEAEAAREQYGKPPVDRKAWK